MVLARWPLAVVTICMLAVPAEAGNVEDDLLHFFGGHGCALGPESGDVAVSAGFDAAAVDAFVAEHRGKGQAVRHRGWVVLPGSECTIRIPEIEAALKVTDPEVVAGLSASDAYEEFPGCFLNSPDVKSRVRAARGWDADKAEIEYLRMLASGIRSGDVTFYNDSPLVTPPTFQVLNGACGDISTMPQIARSQALLVEHFDKLVRASGADLACKEGAGMPVSQLGGMVREMSGDETSNAWIGLEVMILAIGAGWYEGTSATARGTPRPPICHHQ